MNKFLVIFLLFSTCSVVDEEAFYSKTTGTYSLNTTGILFLKKVTGCSEISDTNYITFSGNSSSGGTLHLSYYDDIDNTLKYQDTIATLVEIKKTYQALFKLEKLNSYVAMGLEDDMWISTTNAKSSPDDVLFEHLVPIATQ